MKPKSPSTPTPRVWAPKRREGGKKWRGDPQPLADPNISTRLWEYEVEKMFRIKTPPWYSNG